MATSVDAKMLKQTKFPPEFSQKVDMKKVNVEVMKKWIAGRISEILGNEDDVVIELCFNLLEGARFPDIKVLQIQLTGFLDKDTAKFCKELWNLCLSAQTNPQGVPKELLEAKKLELIQEKIDAEKAAETAQKRHDQEQARSWEVTNIRQRERGERGRGRGRGGYGRDDFDRRRRESRSPPPRRYPSPDRYDRRGPPPRRGIDTYIPPTSRRNERRRPSASPSPSLSRSPSKSRSPPRRRTRDETLPSSRRRSMSRSQTPVVRSNGRGRKRSLPRDEDRSRSVSRNSSRSPRRRHRSPTLSQSPSRSPPTRRRRRHSPSRSPSRDRSSPVDSHNPNRRNGYRSRRSPSYDSYNHRRPGRAADVVKSRPNHDSRRLSRSRSRSREPYSRNRSYRQTSRRSPSSSRSRSRSLSSSPDNRRRRDYRPQQRRRSLERYEPAARRRGSDGGADDNDEGRYRRHRRNTSSVSSSSDRSSHPKPRGPTTTDLDKNEENGHDRAMEVDT